MDLAEESKQITTGKVAKYMLLPGILPRLRRLAGVVGHFLHIFTITFGAAGLIPRDHPCLLTQNIGQYRFRDIVGLAASNVRFSKDNIPQILMFFAVILGFLTSILMVGLLVVNISVGAATAHAQYFSNPTGAIPVGDDLAYEFLHNVFGSTGLDGIWSGNDGGADARSLMTTVLKNMLSTYSQAMLIIAAIIVIYLLIVTVAESAQTGQPFGQKFDTVWAPIRLAVAIGLLVPLGGGYNSAQLIVFQAAHWGSALASNVWHSGVTTFTSGQMVSAVPPDYGYKFVRGAFLIKVCEAGWNTLSTQAQIPFGEQQITVRSSTASSAGTDYRIYKWGTRQYPDFCGEVKIPIPKEGGATYTGTINGVPTTVPIGVFATAVQTAYENIGATLLGPSEGGGIMMDEAQSIVNALEVDMDNTVADTVDIGAALTEWIFDAYWAPLGYVSAEDRFFADGQWPGIISQLDAVAVAAIQEGVSQGWAGAGSFYIRLNELNSISSTAVNTRPVVSKMPVLFVDEAALPTEPGAEDSLFEKICHALPLCTSEREASMKIYSMINKANLWFVKAPIEYPLLAQALNYSTAYEPVLSEQQQGRTQADGSDDNLNEVVANNSPNWLQPNADDLNPLAQLASLGNNLMIGGSAAWVVGIAASFFSPTLGDISFTIGTMLLLAGFALTVVMPMMPFIYFSFAVIEWVISVFEAVVGMPLWALSFLTIGGDGLWGEKAKSGAMMIFEIFLRPTIIVFALIGTILIFSAAVLFFNLGFQRFLSDTGAAAIRSAAYSLLYVFAIYSIGNSIFKLIDEMPNQFMRWIGENVQGYGGFTKAGLSGLDTYAAVKAVEKIQPSSEKIHNEIQRRKDNKKKDDDSSGKGGGLSGLTGRNALFGGRSENPDNWGKSSNWGPGRGRTGNQQGASSNWKPGQKGRSDIGDDQ